LNFFPGCNPLRYVAFDVSLERPFSNQNNFGVDQKVIYMPVKLAGFVQGQAPVTRNAFFNACASASDIYVTPLGKTNVLKSSCVQRQGPLYLEIKKICALFSHAFSNLLGQRLQPEAYFVA
jgi:hypothetical protein